MSAQPSLRKDRRSKVANACQRCRKRKIKCSGSIPCTTCTSKGELCQKGAQDKHVVVSLSTLRELQSKADRYDRREQPNAAVADGSSSPRDATNSANNEWSNERDENDGNMTGATPSGNDHPDLSGHTNAPIDRASNLLVPKEPRYMRDGEGQLRYLGHSSTFSFSRQVLLMLREHPHFGSHQFQDTPLAFDADTHLETEVSQLSQIDLTGLPSLEVALLTVQVVKFRTNPLYYLFDESTFMQSLSQFYTGLSIGLHPSRVWFVHYLLIMALGTALNSQFAGMQVPGIHLFQRAFRLLPDMTILYRDPLTSIEILCCIALYLSSMDHRSASYIYMGEALRLSQVEGLHTNLQERSVGRSFLERGQRVWWTVYSLDRRFSSSLGVPDSIVEGDITAPCLPHSETPCISAAQAMNVRICRVVGRMVHRELLNQAFYVIESNEAKGVYSPDNKVGRDLISTAQEVLRSIGDIMNDLLDFSSRSVGEISVVVAQLNLALHQCIVLCTRPFLFQLLKMRLESADPAHPLPLLNSSLGLVQAGVDSAVQIAVTINQLRQHNLLDFFLPFDLESIFSSGLVLAIVKGIHPRLLPAEDWMSSILAALDYLAAHGNNLAIRRKMEIEELLAIRWNRSRPHRANHNSDLTPLTMPQTSPESTDIPSLVDPFFDIWGVDDGLSGAQLISLADALDFPEAANLITF